MRMIVCLVLSGSLAGPMFGQDVNPSHSAAASKCEVSVRDGETVIVRVAVSDAANNLLSAVSFPEQIAEIISAWNPKDLSIEHGSNRLFLKLLSKTEGHLDVVLSSGAHVRLFLAVSGADAADSHVVVKLPESRPRPPAAAATGSGALELIRAMRLGEVPAGASIRTGGKEIIFESKVVEARMLLAYDTMRYSGFVVELTNRSTTEAYHIDLTKFAAENLVLAAARDVVLKPDSSTKLYLVFWK